MDPTRTWNWIKKHCKPEWKTAFWSAAILGLLIHLPAMLMDVPNHDGLDSMYFDQNMITSGRWFLTVACGFSSYFTLPWVIGLIAVLNLALCSVALTEFLELRRTWSILLVSGLLVSFPALASTFAYVFTMDGYMLALLLAVLSALLTSRFRKGFLAGAVCLALSMGTYQAYLPFAVLLCIYGILMLALSELSLREKFRRGLRYLYMGVLGAVLYYGMLQILLGVQGKALDTYQGISGGIGGSGGLGGAGNALGGLPSLFGNLYRDFFAFTLKGTILWNDFFSAAALLLLTALTCACVLRLVIRKKWWKNPWFYLILVLLAAGIPLASNLILVVSPEVTYHLLMRYQWALLLILMVAFVSRYGLEDGTDGRPGAADSSEGVVGRPGAVDLSANTGERPGAADLSANAGDGSGANGSAGRGLWSWEVLSSWGILLAAGVLVFHYAVTDNIAYSNLQKRYEKTYAYCIRLLDRIEQTPGYYQGIPIAMIGVVGEEQFPPTDVTGKVTSNMIGLSGDFLLYRGTNYEAFLRHYLGATLNILPQEAMEEAYYEDFYLEMGSFPAPDSIQIVDGILYVKTENVNR